MAQPATPLDEAVSIVSRLNPLDKVRLMERLAAMLGTDLAVTADRLPESLNDEMPRPTTFQDLAAWLDVNPPVEAWGGLRDNEDAGVYIHRLRRQATVWLDEPGDGQ
ncbi:MAG: hypothetical protein JXQ72_08525 [Anaerolineae bacterium]|nr:hypothetical protein [Anaerolineae bacterium]